MKTSYLISTSSTGINRSTRYKNSIQKFDARSYSYVSNRHKVPLPISIDIGPGQRTPTYKLYTPSLPKALQNKNFLLKKTLPGQRLRKLYEL